MRNTAPATGWSNTIPAATRSAAPAATTASSRRWTTRRTSTNWQVIERAKKRLFYSLLQLAPAARHAQRGPRPRPALRVPLRRGRGAAGDDRPRKRHHHAGPQGGRRRRARAPPHRDEGALPHPARPFPPRGRPLLLGPADRQPAGARPSSARCSATSAPTTARRCSATTRTARRPTGSRTTSRPTPPRTRGRTGPRPGRISSTSSTPPRWPSAFGVRLNPKVDVTGELKTRIDFDPYRLDAIDELIRPLGAAGVADQQPQSRRRASTTPIPFVLTPHVVAKLGFIQKVVRDAGARAVDRARARRPDPHQPAAAHDARSSHEAVDY